MFYTGESRSTNELPRRRTYRQNTTATRFSRTGDPYIGRAQYHRRSQAKLPLTPWNPWAACLKTHLMTLVSL